MDTGDRRSKAVICNSAPLSGLPQARPNPACGTLEWLCVGFKSHGVRVGEKGCHSRMNEIVLAENKESQDDLYVEMSQDIWHRDLN